MRALALIAALAVAAPAAAQDLNTLNQAQLDDLRMQQQMLQQRSIALSNELMAAEARLRADQAILGLQLQRALPARVPELPYPVYVPAAAPAKFDASKLPSIPDAALAASNERVRAASENKR
jgi:hypothetical protein